MAAAVLIVAGYLALAPGGDDLRRRAGTFVRAPVVATRVDGANRVDDLRLVSTSGLAARCMIRFPARGGARSPAFLIAAGYETGRHAVTFPELDRVILISCDYPLEVPADVEGLARWRTLASLRRGLLDSPATLLLALDYLRRRPDVDPDAVGIVGASVGVPAATVAAALDPRVAAVALLYGGGRLDLLYAHNVDLGSRLENTLARAAVRVLTYPIEPTRYAGSISPRPVLAINAPDDPFIPRACALALHRALREPKEIRWLSLDHFAAFHERELLAELTELTVTWFVGRGVGAAAGAR